jgi:hypothetical protein
MKDIMLNLRQEVNTSLIREKLGSDLNFVYKLKNLYI